MKKLSKNNIKVEHNRENKRQNKMEGNSTITHELASRSSGVEKSGRIDKKNEQLEDTEKTTG